MPHARWNIPHWGRQSWIAGWALQRKGKRPYTWGRLDEWTDERGSARLLRESEVSSTVPFHAHSGASPTLDDRPSRRACTSGWRLRTQTSGHATLMSMDLGLTACDLGRCTFSTPSLKSAMTFCWSTSVGTAIRRTNFP